MKRSTGHDAAHARITAWICSATLLGAVAVGLAGPACNGDGCAPAEVDACNSDQASCMDRCPSPADDSSGYHQCAESCHASQCHCIEVCGETCDATPAGASHDGASSPAASTGGSTATSSGGGSSAGACTEADLDACEAAQNSCTGACPSPATDPDGYAKCYTDCTTARCHCVEACGATCTI